MSGFDIFLIVIVSIILLGFLIWGYNCVKDACILKFGTNSLHKQLVKMLWRIDILQEKRTELNTLDEELSKETFNCLANSPLYNKIVLKARNSLVKLAEAYSKLDHKKLKAEYAKDYYKTLDKAKKYLKDFELLVF